MTEIQFSDFKNDADKDTGSISNLCDGNDSAYISVKLGKECRRIRASEIEHRGQS